MLPPRLLSSDILQCIPLHYIPLSTVKLDRFYLQAQLYGLSQEACSADTQRSHDQIRATVASRTGTKALCSAQKQSFKVTLPHISRLEQLSAAASIRELDVKKAIAVLCGNRMRYFIKSTAIDLGRSTNTLGKVPQLCSAWASSCLHQGAHSNSNLVNRKVVCSTAPQSFLCITR